MENQANQPIALNNELIQTISNANQAINNVYKLQIEENNLRCEADQQRNSAKHKRKQYKEQHITLFLISLVVCGYVAYLIPLLITDEIWNVISNNSFIRFLFESESRYYTVMGIVTLVISVIVLAITFIIPCGDKKHISIAEAAEQNAEYKRQQIETIIVNSSNDVSIIAPEYRYPQATAYMLRLFELGRATSLPEAYDKYEEQLHRWKMESAMNTLIKTQVAQLQFLQKISYDTDWI